ncbi:MAG TPA: sensor histidine kinase [Vicinamibacterales bacterium]|nr:sensor histidine kinase [Vicinamibacterales bacterium]
MRSLRLAILVGAGLWTLGLLAAWAVLLTLNHRVFMSVAVVHAYPHSLGVLAIGSMLVGFAMVRAGLKPLNEIRRRLADVQSGRARQVLGEYPSEVQPLVRDLNGLLAHQEQAVSRAVAKAGDLAHGLKTPLAVLSQEAERAAGRGQPELAAAIGEQVERMRRQIEYHLAHARAAASGATPGLHCPVRPSAEGLARTLRRLHADRGLAIALDVPAELAVRCPREDLDEMLGNLLDNACKWARGRIRLSAEPAGGDVALVVDDDGPGLAPAMRAAVLQRGVRADEAAPGSGFGLAIVGEIAAVYGGAIALETSPLGGLRARLTLPSA